MAQPPLGKKLFYSGISGAIGTTCIYPLDITKTKLQDQKIVSGIRTFKGPLDCALQILRVEGFRGLFRGWPPNVLLVIPEKAIKITMNDLFRAYFLNRNLNSGGTNKLYLWQQMAAGGLAGLCQVVATNPMELLKIQGATMLDKFKKGEIKEMIGYRQLVSRLGFSGLYTGVMATLLRDIPFSMMYFSLYATVNDSLAASSPQNVNLNPFLAGAVAGTIAAASTTPLDVIKTRVHSRAQPIKISGSPFYVLSTFFSRESSLIVNNIRDIAKNEGAPAFFKGVIPRTLIISPLFAITMTCYEAFKSRFG